jgi:hypothetical protein
VWVRSSLSTSDLIALLGLFLAVLAVIASGFAFLSSEKKDLEARLRRIEEEHVFLRPWVERAKRKLEEDGDEWTRS